MIALLVALSCQDDAMLDALAPPDVAVELAVESKKVGGAEELVLELRLTALDEWEAEPFELEFEDLEVEELSAEILELPGGEQTVYRYGVNGKAGSHVLLPQTFSFRSSDGKILERESSKSLWTSASMVPLLRCWAWQPSPLKSQVPGRGESSGLCLCPSLDWSVHGGVQAIEEASPSSPSCAR